MEESRNKEAREDLEAVDDAVFGVAGFHLVEDPSVGFFQSGAKGDGGFPAEFLFYQGVVAAAAADSFGGVELVGALEFNTGDVFDQVDELVDGNHFGAAEVDRLDDPAFHDGLGAVEAVVDVLEAAGLKAVAPDLDLFGAAELGGDDFAADGGRGLLASAIEGAVRPVDVVVAGDAGLEAEVFHEVAAHALGEQFFPAIAVLGVSGVGVFLFQTGVVGFFLFVAGVDAGGGGVEEPGGAAVAGGHEHVGVDQDAEHAEAFVQLDEAHATHVGGEIVDPVGAIDGLDAGVFVLEVKRQVLRLGEALIPLPLGLFVDGADLVSLLEHGFDEVAADESTGAGHEDVGFAHKSIEKCKMLIRWVGIDKGAAGGRDV